MTIRVGVVIPCLNQFKAAMEALESLKTRYIWTPYIEPQWRRNWSLSKAWNAGATRAIEDGCHYILIINDDIVFSPRTVDELVQAFNGREIDMITASNQRGNMQVSDIYDFAHIGDEILTPHPDFACFMIKKTHFDKYGYFDENFIPAYFEDNDMHYRMKLVNGEKAFSTNKAPYFHHGSATQNSEFMGVVNASMFDNNRIYYVQKWGGPPGEEKWTTPYNEGGSPTEWKKIRF